jgi:hypothetical protein
VIVQASFRNVLVNSCRVKQFKNELDNFITAVNYDRNSFTALTSGHYLFFCFKSFEFFLFEGPTVGPTQ